MRINNVKASGFTLIEVLIGLTLLSVMLTLLFSVLSICAQSWEAGEQKLAEVNEIATVNNFFRQYLSQARAMPDEFSDDKKQLAFDGQSKQVQFVSAFSASAGKSGLQLIKIHLHGQHGEQALQVSIKPLFQEQEDNAWLDVNLLNRVSAFKLAYLGSDLDEGWQNSWQDQTEMPALIKVEIKYNEQSIWSEQVIAVHSRKFKALDILKP